MSSGGKLVVISGPSGVGKSAVCAELLGFPCFRRVVTCTTRAPRQGESEGDDYFFLSNEEFDAKIARDEFLEYAPVHGQRYGTLREQVEACLAEGHYVLLAIDVQGARELRRKAKLAPREARRESRHSEAPEGELTAKAANRWSDKLITIFLVPPDRKTLQERLLKRGTETQEQLTERLRAAEDEMAVKDEFDEIIVNDDLETAVEEILRCLDVPEGLCRGSGNRMR